MNAIDRYAVKQHLTGRLVKEALYGASFLKRFRGASGADKVRWFKKSLPKAADPDKFTALGTLAHSPEEIAKYRAASLKNPTGHKLHELSLKSEDAANFRRVENKNIAELKAKLKDPSADQGDLAKQLKSMKAKYKGERGERVSALRRQAKPFQKTKRDARKLLGKTSPVTKKSRKPGARAKAYLRDILGR